MLRSRPWLAGPNALRSIETPRVHHASRRWGGRVAARGASAAAGKGVAHRRPHELGRGDALGMIAKKVFQPCEGCCLLCAMYFATVVCPTSKFQRLRPSLCLEAKGLDQLLHVFDLVSHKPAHLLRGAAGDDVAVFGQLCDQLWSMSRLHEFPI